MLVCRGAPPPLIALLCVFLIWVFFNICSACSNGNCQILESCSSATDCSAGLYCGNCPAASKLQPLCLRGQSNIPTSVNFNFSDDRKQPLDIVGERACTLRPPDPAMSGIYWIGGLPFNKYSWLVTHNAFSNVNAPALPGVQRITFYNQEDTVTNQLRNGVRGLMLDMYDFNNDIWLCHSFGGQCYNITAFGPAIDTLREVEAFLSQNPTEIVTIIIEDYVHAPKGLTNLFMNAGLDKYWFPVAKMPKKGEDWPLVTDMIQQNHRLLAFTSDGSKEAAEGIAYQWKYMVENEPGDPGVKPGSCPNRKESKKLGSGSAFLFLMNYFPTYPVQANACKVNSAPLADMVGTCYKSARNTLPNFIAVNFYMRSDGGGVFDILDRMNGERLCGCSTIVACQAGAPFGSCKSIAAPITASTSSPGSFSGSVELSGSASSVLYPDILLSCFYLSFMILSTYL